MQLLPLLLVAFFCCCCSSSHGASVLFGGTGEWGAWGPCTRSCNKFRRRADCPHGSLSSRHCRWQFQRHPCTEHPSCKPSANFSSFDCGQRPTAASAGALGVVMRIFGGEESQPHSWPWHVNLVHAASSDRHFCGGTLVHPQFVLTARHCVATGSGSLRRLYAKVGDHDRRRQPRELWLPVAKVLTHPKLHEANIEYDMALLKLERPAPMSAHVSLACLPGGDESPEPGASCTAVGFGRHRPGGAMSDVMREVQLRVQSPRHCYLEYAATNVRINPSIHVCATATGRDTCSGDSGGGLFCRQATTGRWFLHGVTSFGHPSGCGSRSGVFQRVGAIAAWVRETVAMEMRLTD